MRAPLRCVPCVTFLLGMFCMCWTVDALAQPPGGPLTEISAEAIFAALISTFLLVVSGFTARNDRDMRELRNAMKEQFGAVGMEQRQQQAQITLLVERFGDRPSRQELTDLRLELAGRFDRMEDLLRHNRSPG